MANDQVLVNVPQVKSVPLDYVVPGAQEIVIQSVTSTFDGSGAGGNFLPALQIIGPGGVVAGTYVDQSNQITAGNSAEVTFGPFLRTASSSGGGGITDVVALDSSIHVVSGSGPTVGLQAIPFTMKFEQAGGSTSVASGGPFATYIPLSHSAGDTLLDYSTPANPTLITSGWYMAVTLADSSPTNIGAAAFVEMSVLLSGSNSRLTLPGNGSTLFEATLPLPLHHCSAGDPIGIAIDHNQGSNLTFDGTFYLTKVAA